MWILGEVLPENTLEYVKAFVASLLRAAVEARRAPLGVGRFAAARYARDPGGRMIER